jgi:hypothetical protein
VPDNKEEESMFRLWIFIAQLIAFMLVFTFLVRALVPFPIDVLIGFIGAILTIYAISAFSEAGALARDIRLVRNASENAISADGARIAVIGALRAVALPLRAPFSRRECVYYRYVANRSEAEEDAREGEPTGEYSGLALTRCVIKSATRETRLAGVPMIKGFEGETVTLSGDECYRNAEDYVATTRFEHVSLADTDRMVRSIRTNFDEREGQVRRDVRLEQAGPIRELMLRETIIPVGVEVCAVGTWSSDQAGLIQKFGTREMLTLYAGGADEAAARIARSMKTYVLGGGASVAVIASLVAWRLVSL